MTTKKSNLLDSFNALSPVALGLDDFMEGLTEPGQSCWPTWTNDYHFNTSGFPPYDCYKDEDGNYNVHVAVPGFAKEDLKVQVFKNMLFIEGEVNKTAEDSRASDLMTAASRVTFHSKIGFKSFKHKFIIPPYAKVEHSALENGILKIKIKVEKPEDNAETINIDIQ